MRELSSRFLSCRTLPGAYGKKGPRLSWRGPLAMCITLHGHRLSSLYRDARLATNRGLRLYTYLHVSWRLSSGYPRASRAKTMGSLTP